MNRAEHLNRRIDKHFKSNKGNWKVEDYLGKELKSSVCLTYDAMRGFPKIASKWVALFILRNEPSVEFVDFGTTIYTRNTLRRAGMKI